MNFQLENGFLSQEGSKEKIPDILTTILHGLNAERKCTIPISEYSILGSCWHNCESKLAPFTSKILAAISKIAH
jgi:hypothetical protein